MVIGVKLLKETVKNMGKVENIQLLVMPDPWFDFIVSNGDKGECPETFEQCEKYLSEYKGIILVFFISLIFICLLGTYRIIVKINQIQFTAQGQHSKLDSIEFQNQSNPIYCARSAQ